MKKMIKFIKNIDKNWFITIGTLVLMWAIFNVSAVGFLLFTEGEAFGKTTFWEAFKELTFDELFILTLIGTLVLSIVLLFKPLSGGNNKT